MRHRSRLRVVLLAAPIALTASCNTGTGSDTGEGVTNVTSIVGGGAMRFLLTYAPEKTDSCYAQLMVDVDDYTKIDALSTKIQEHLDGNFPDAMCMVKKFLLGPGGGGKIQARFRGPDPVELRKLAEKAELILYQDRGAGGIRNDWLQQVKVIDPVFNDAQARRLGITQPDLASSISAIAWSTPSSVSQKKVEFAT